MLPKSDFITTNGRCTGGFVGSGGVGYLIDLMVHLVTRVREQGEGSRWQNIECIIDETKMSEPTSYCTPCDK